MRCDVIGCSAKRQGRQMVCAKHYEQIRKTGSTHRTIYDGHDFVQLDGYYRFTLYRKDGIKCGTVRIDSVDYDFVSAHKWCLDSVGYVASSSAGGRLHALLLKAPKGFRVDHIRLGARGKLDNRRSNLRVVTASQNNVHRGQLKTNTSGYKGIRWNEREGRWKAYTSYQNSQVSLGTHSTLEDAIEAYNSGVKRIHGEFAPLHPTQGACHEEA